MVNVNVPDPQVVELDTVSITSEARGAYVGGYSGQITITNTSDQTLADWSLTFTSNYAISGGWGGDLIHSDSSTYTLVPSSWNRTLEPGESISFGIEGNETISNFGIFRLVNAATLNLQDTQAVA